MTANRLYSSLTPSPSFRHTKTTSSQTCRKPHRRAVLQWIPAQCGIPGYEQAYILAKDGARGKHHANNVSLSEDKTLIRALTLQDYHLLYRNQQAVLVRLLTGHNRLNSHMHGKLKLAFSPTCSCVQEVQTTEHVLQRCLFHKATREDVWVFSTPLMTKFSAASWSWRSRRHSSPERS